jgi:UDP-N-acetylmuramoyl-tripeptide--D-alanyl-D-alanine ligase
MDEALRGLAVLRDGRPGPLVAVLGDMLELGAREDELHAEVGHGAAGLGLDAVATLGPRASHLARAVRSSGIDVHEEPDAGDAAVARTARWLESRFRGEPKGAVLVKASRGMRLERLVEALVGRSAWP